MSVADSFMLALTAWRENRGGDTDGMQSVINVIMNRSKKHGTLPYTECVKPLQFSSLTAKGDPELTLWPTMTDPQFGEAQLLAEDALAGDLKDLTGGATLYYAPKSIMVGHTTTLPDGQVVPFPRGWNAQVVQYTATVADQLFFKEL